MLTNPTSATQALLSKNTRIVPIVASDAASPRNDTASVAELPDGRLMVVWHKYRPSTEGGSDFGIADIAAKYSSDGGRSWGQERILARCAEGDINIQAPALCLLPSGELLMIALRAHGRSSSSMVLFRSGDAGQTWRETTAIWSRSPGQWLQGGTSSLLLLASGHLLVPFHGGQGGQSNQHNVAGCFVSNYDGQAWRKTPAKIDLPMRGAMEASVAQLANGRLVMSLRTQLGTPMLCESRDEGESWSLPWSAGLTAPESCTCLRTIGKSDDLLLIWNGCTFYEPAHHHYGQRNPLSLALSRDAGRSWTRLGDVERDPQCAFTNLNCTFLKNGDAVITYWATSPPFGRSDQLKLSETRAAIVARDFWQSLAPSAKP